MQGGERRAQAASVLDYLMGVGGKFFIAGILVLEGESRLYRADDLALLRRFAGVKFKAELAYAYLVEPLFYDLKSGLLFGHEQHALARIDGVGDYVGYCLALARAGGTVKDERSALGALGNGGVLR